MLIRAHVLHVVPCQTTLLQGTLPVRLADTASCKQVTRQPPQFQPRPEQEAMQLRKKADDIAQVLHRQLPTLGVVPGCEQVGSNGHACASEHEQSTGLPTCWSEAPSSRLQAYFAGAGTHVPAASSGRRISTLARSDLE